MYDFFHARFGNEMSEPWTRVDGMEYWVLVFGMGYQVQSILYQVGSPLPPDLREANFGLRNKEWNKRVPCSGRLIGSVTP